MTRWQTKHHNPGIKTRLILLLGLAATVLLGKPLSAVELPPEMPLWENGSPEYPIRLDVEEQVRSHKAQPGSPTGRNRAFSSVSLPTYSIHRPAKQNGVGLVICPGGGFRDIWIDREGHDLAIWLKDHGVTSLVLKYRTRPAEMTSREMWQDYQNAVQADGRRAIRILREQAKDLGLDSHKIGICGFSAGGHLAISCALYGDPKSREPKTSGMPDFCGLYYPGIPDGAQQAIESRSAPESATSPMCPVFIVNARVDKLTPADKCVDFYAALLKTGVNAEIHVFSKGNHGFGLGEGRGDSTALWPTSFVAWLHDCGIIED
jgi:acetyl esterase/lipase